MNQPTLFDDFDKLIKDFTDGLDSTIADIKKAELELTESEKEYVDRVELKIPAYFNTTNETGPELASHIQTATKQNDAILGLFQRFRILTPSACLKCFETVLRLTPPPLTSIRRGITTLTIEGKLEKLDSKCMGLYGRMEYEWKLK